ncbi:Seipin [Aphelenchoides bicaudatus]|nr:Seipin [Aphelenchoides bicaudatus]
MVPIQEIPSTFRLVRNQANVTPGKIFILIVQLAALFFASLLLPLFIRYLLAVPFVELNEPLEFTFHTCTDQLHGVCSFPEAEIIFDERNIAFDGGYRYRFALSMDIIDVEILRATGLFLAQVEVRDDKAETLAVIKKTVRVTSAGFYGWYIWLRNWAFLPLYLVGLLGDGGVNKVIVDFPSDFRETFSRPAKFVVVQVQNRFIQVSSASLTYPCQCWIVVLLNQ